MNASRARTSTKRVVFAESFNLGGSGEIYPPGAYDIITDEDAYEGNERTTYVRTGTVLVIRTRGGTLHRSINGKDLDEALNRDRANHSARQISENPDRGIFD